MAASKTPTAIALVKPTTTAVEVLSASLHGYLEGLALPTQKILVGPDERRKVIANLPELIQTLSEAQRGEAMYISKFVAATAVGLFDAALNFAWNEVVVRLRRRVAAFDLAYFYDTAVPASERQDYRTEDDLAYLSDAALIQGALKCGMITDVGYKHLDYIRDMRNWASAAHPNQVELTGLQLTSWLETCLKEVILKEPEGPVLEVGRLLHNLREQTIAQGDVAPIAASIDRLPPDLVAALLRALAGMYCDPKQQVRVRDNIKLVAKKVWTCAEDKPRYEIGLKYATYGANGDVARKALAYEFLELVEGLTFLTDSDLALQIQERVTELESAQDNFDNFFNEPPIARRLRRLIPDNGRIPDQINEEYVRVLVRCRVGRPSGVANAAVPFYDEMIDLFDAPQLRAFLKTVSRPEISARVAGNAGCFARYNAIATKLEKKAVSVPLKRALDAIAKATQPQLGNLHLVTAFQKLVADATA